MTSRSRASFFLASRIALPSAFLAALLGGSWSACPAQTAPATTTPPFALLGRHAITVRLGMQSSGSATVMTGVLQPTVDARATGFAGALSYDYGVGPEWTVGIALGALDLEGAHNVGPGSVRLHATTVTALLVGAAWYPVKLTIGQAMRPYASAAVGSYRRGVSGMTAAAGGATLQYTASSAPGIRLAGGVDWFVGHRLRAGISGGFHVVADLERQEGLKRNASGPELSLGLGVLLGSGKK